MVANKYMWHIALLLTASVSFAPEPYGGVILQEEALDAADKVNAELFRIWGMNASLVGICVAENTNIPSYCLHYKEYGTVHVSRPCRLLEWFFDLENDQTCVCEGIR